MHLAHSHARFFGNLTAHGIFQRFAGFDETRQRLITPLGPTRLATEQSVMPDEEIGIAGHMFTIDYDPAGPEAFLSAHKELDEEVVQERAKTSLMDKILRRPK